jgi:RNA polymerase sigma-70 factor (ECF subfamily)
MAQLPLDLHVAIELFYFEDLPASTVAAVLDVPEGTVRSRVRRAIAQLRDEIERVAAPANVTDAALDGVDTLVHSKP